MRRDSRRSLKAAKYGCAAVGAYMFLLLLFGSGLDGVAKLRVFLLSALLLGVNRLHNLLEQEERRIRWERRRRARKNAEAGQNLYQERERT